MLRGSLLRALPGATLRALPGATLRALPGATLRAVPGAAAAALGLLVLGLSTSCSAGRDLGQRPTSGDTGGFTVPDGTDLDDGGVYDLEAGAPYAVLGVQPSHGPFTGGSRVEVRGRGFSSQTKVRFGSIEIPATDTVAADPFHVQVVVPPGEVGPTDIFVEDLVSGAKASLGSGYTYDSYYADPNTGATTGGTHVSLVGRGTSWKDGTTVTIDGKPCGELAIDDATHLHCVAPAGTPGTKSISVTTPDMVVATVRDAYTYSDTADGYRGGLAGAKLPGELKVLALVNPDGDLLPDATVIVRGADGAIQKGTTSGGGLASFPTPPKAPLTVTIAKKCIQPSTFDGVNVRSVTMYLNPVMSVACMGSGTPPPVGGKLRDAGVIEGELVWPGAVEFKRAVWKGVPDPKTPTQRAAAYVWAAAGDNLTPFQLPDAATATLQTSPGTLGYQYMLPVIPGNLTLYAIAGIEDRPTTGGAATFDPYVYGIVRGIGVKPGDVVTRVNIAMNGSFTHSVSYLATGAPTSVRGPDRLRSSISVDLGAGFMILPYATHEDLLPIGGAISFVGVPPLSGALGTSWYVASIEDVTGGSGGAPLSSVLRYRFHDSSKPVSPGPFIPLPKVTFPTAESPWDGRTLEIDLPDKTADLFVVGLVAGDGSTAWTVIAKGDARTINLPDFTAAPELGMPTGNLGIGISAARIDGFVWDEVRYGQLSKKAWNAYSRDTLIAKF